MGNGYYVAIIADIKDSRKSNDRSALQERLRSILDAVNNRFEIPFSTKFMANPPSYYKPFLDSMNIHPISKNDASGDEIEWEDMIASNFMLTLGDEFQGLLSCSNRLMQLLDHIERHMFPNVLRFGIGIGEIHTSINKKHPFGMDGPAYHIARDRISQLKASERRTMEPTANICIGIQGDDRLSLVANTMCSLLSLVKSSWTEHQVRVMNVFMDSGLQKQQRTAEILGITQSAVNKALNASNFYTYQYALHILSLVLGDVGTKYASVQKN